MFKINLESVTFLHLIFMEFTQFISNIQSDILLKTVPSVAVKTGAIVVANGGFSQIESYKEDLTHFTVESATNVLSRNLVEYVMYNASNKPTSFGKKLAIRFSSRTFGTFLTKIMFSKDKDIKTMVLDPLFSGFLSVVGYMTLNHDESSRYLRAYFPEIHEAIVNTGSALGLTKPANWLFSKIDGY